MVLPVTSMVGTGSAGWATVAWMVRGGAEVFAALIIVAAALFILAAGIHMLRVRRRQALVRDLLARQRATEEARRSLFTGRRVDPVSASAPEAGLPRTVVSEGRIVFTESGDMLRFGSAMEGSDDGVVAAALAPGRPAPRPEGERPPPAVSASAQPTYRVERVVALHGSGVAMLSVDVDGKVERGDLLEPGLLMLMEELIEETRWSALGTAHGVHLDRSVCVCNGGEMHLAAVVDGDGDERLDRELRRALGQLRTSVAWRLGRERDVSSLRDAWTELARTMQRALEPTRLVDASRGGAVPRGGELRTTSSVAMRGGTVEYIVGMVNGGPGPVYDVQLLPTLGQEGVLEVLTSRGIDVDASGSFVVREVAEGAKATAVFVFRPLRLASVRIDCTIVYLRGVADVRELRLPGRWVDVEGVDVAHGEEVEPERALELATEPSAFVDRSAFFLPPGIETRPMLDACTGALRRSMRQVATLEEPEGDHTEVWFHGELAGAATMVACVSVIRGEGVVDLFVASTVAGAVPGAMLILREAAARAAGGGLVQALDPEGRSAAARRGFLLESGWGEVPR